MSEGIPILAVTDEAVGALTEALEQADSDDDRTLRLVQDEGQYRFTLDEEREGDQVIKSGDRPVLVVATEVSQSLDGVALEFADAPDGGQLRLAKAS